jgi:hypothetical protein|tara:strand:- start:104 stop:979 length:876 start_codon:yes stop_codon:yes gene_type:complete
MNLFSLDLSGPRHNALIAAGIDTVEKLIAVTDKELLSIPGFTEEDFRQIRWAEKKLLAKHPSLRDRGQEEDGLRIDLGTEIKNENQSVKQKLEPANENRRLLTYLKKLTHKIVAYLRDLVRRLQELLEERFKDAASSSSGSEVAVSKQNGLTNKEEFFEWPSTDAPAAKYGFSGDCFWYKHGLLQYVGYKVGNTGRNTVLRRRILDSVFHNTLPNVNNSSYMREWNKPKSAKRLRKMANAIANFCKNSKRRQQNTGVNLSKAIEDWEDDLYYLYVDYYRGRFGFKWPQTTI